MGKNCLVKMEIIALKRWFQIYQRDLPWRRNATPYQVWVSEIMLQQTQVAVVIPYFERWMQRFPTIEALAAASREEVIKEWEGLGYYSRARNLHAAAQYLMVHHKGALPEAKEELEKIKGLGPYTVGAILSFAFHQKAAAIDANVARVLSRYYLIEDPITHTHTQLKLKHLVETLLPSEEPWVVMEALIELGAKICQKLPQCARCPLAKSCMGTLTDRAKTLPNKGKKIAYITLEKKAAVLLFQDHILLKKGSIGNVMADLYEFPIFENSIENELGLQTTFLQNRDKIKYSYTRYRVTLIPSIWQVHEKKEVKGFVWIPIEEAQRLPFSSGHRRLFRLIQKH